MTHDAFWSQTALKWAGIAAFSLLSLIVPSNPAEGGESKEEAVRYVRRSWQTEDGLLDPKSRAIIQSEDGYLWVATEDGLVRFDGARFSGMETKTGSATYSRWIVGLTETRDGSIWTSSSNGGISRLINDEIIHYTTADGLPNNLVLTLFEDSQGVLWIGSLGGLTRYEEGTFTTYPSTNGWVEQSVRCIIEDGEGYLWIGTPEGLYRMKDGQFAHHTKSDWLGDNSVMALHVDRDDNLWVGTSEGLTFRSKDGVSRHYTVSDGLAHESIRAIHQDRAGTVWIGSHGGLQQIREGQVVTVVFRERFFSAVTDSLSDFVYSIYEDREGSLWVGSNIGLHQINAQKLGVFSKEEGLTHALTTTVYEDREENIWVATWGGGLNRISGGEVTNWTTTDGLASDHLFALHQDREGSLWIGTDGFGIHRFAGGRFEHYPLEGARPENTIRVVFEDSRGRLWAGGNAGLSLFQDGTFVATESLFGLNLEMVYTIVEDEEGMLWVGSKEGLTGLDGEGAPISPTAVGFHSSPVTAIYPDGTGVLWVASDEMGLSRFEPGKTIIDYSGASSSFQQPILHILEDGAGFLWMSSRQGISRVSKAELNAFAAGETSFVSHVSYGKAEGMRRVQCSGSAQPAGWKGRDGRLWFPTMAGVVFFNPANTRTNELPPSVIIEHVLVDGKKVAIIGDAKIPPGQGRLEVHFTALSFQVPEKVRFRFMLEGFDHEWQEGGPMRSAIYHHLPPGEYRFRVTASNNDGVWNAGGAEFQFILAPHFYQTYWFFIFCALALTSSGAGAYALRMKWMRCRHQELTRLVGERTQKLEEEIRERVAAQRRIAAFSRLGQQLSLASTQVEAARIIVSIADELIGWDSCGLHSYSSALDVKTPVLYYDLVDGVRQEVHAGTEDPNIKTVMRKTIEEGAQLVLREAPAFEGDFSPFGDMSRPSSSLMFAPMRKGTSVVGVLSAHSYSANAFDQQDLETLQALADYCGGAFERIRIEEALRESQNVMLHQERLAAIGQLSSGAAHEFNNILTIIQGHSCLLLDEGNLKPETAQSLREISESADRAANLTRQLLTFSRKQFMRQEVLNLNAVIREVTNMLSRLLGEHITVRCRFSSTIPAVRADPGMMEQTIMNLSVNARDAMAGKGGELGITTGDVQITRQNPHPEARPGHFVRLSVSDTGCGMDAATMARIFEPFYTTKGVGEGTGLGLSSVYGIVQQHRGWIEVKSEVGKGTTFDVYLPATDEKIPPPSSCIMPENSFPGREETILLVEDETCLRKMIADYLTAMDYRVLAAHDGVAALKLWREHEGQIDLLLTDMVLPGGISGGELAAQLRQEAPSLAVILTSGYSQEILKHDSTVDESVTFVPKPYSPTELAEVIRRKLTAKGNGQTRSAASR